MIRLLCLCFVLSIGVGVGVQAKTYYVSKNGSDTNLGTEIEPFKTIGRAKDWIRNDITNGLTEDVFVKIGSGIYVFSEPLVLILTTQGTVIM